MCFKSPEYVISLCFYHKTQPPPPNPRSTHGGLSDWSWLGHMMLHMWDRLLLRSNVLALPLEAKSQSGIHGAQAHVGLDVWFQVVSAPPTHTLTVHIFFWGTHKYTHLLPFLPFSLPSNVILLPGNASSLEEKKALHCFPAIHSSCLKVPASKGENTTWLVFRSGYICVNLYEERKTWHFHEWNEAREPFGHIRAERPPVRHIVAAFFNQMDLLGHLETHISTPA